jgi:hypothetical protein
MGSPGVPAGSGGAAIGPFLRRRGPWNGPDRHAKLQRVNVPPELASVLGAAGTAAVFLIRRLARWISWRWLRAKVQREARGSGDAAGPQFGTVGWVWNELVRERGQRHALVREVSVLAQRVSRLEGRSDSGEQPRLEYGPTDNDTDKDPQPPWPAEEPRTPVDPAIARARARRSRP